MKPKFAHKIRIVGRFIDLTAKTDIAATFARVKREQAAITAEKLIKVTAIRKAAK